MRHQDGQPDGKYGKRASQAAMEPGEQWRNYGVYRVCTGISCKISKCMFIVYVKTKKGKKI
jgi:hypothetical protein